METLKKQWEEMSVRNKARVAIVGLVFGLATCGAIMGPQDSSSSSGNCSYYTCVNSCARGYEIDVPAYGRDEALRRQSSCQSKCSRCK